MFAAPMVFLFLLLKMPRLWRLLAAPVWRLFIITGCLGALTTFSTFSLETVQLLQNGHIGTAVSNVVLNVVASLTLTYAGLLTGRWIH